VLLWLSASERGQGERRRLRGSRSAPVGRPTEAVQFRRPGSPSHFFTYLHGPALFATPPRRMCSLNRPPFSPSKTLTASGPKPLAHSLACEIEKDPELSLALALWPKLPEPLRNALARWPEIPEPIRRAIVALLETVPN